LDRPVCPLAAEGIGNGVNFKGNGDALRQYRDAIAKPA